MSDDHEKGPRLYKALGADGEVAWVDHDELWRLQQSQAEGLRRGQARRRRLVLLAAAGLVALALVLAVFLTRSATAPPPGVAVGSPPVETSPQAPVAERPATAAVGVAEPSPATADLVARAVAAWAAAWADQDVPAYLGGYSSEFRPADRSSRASWESLRRQRLLAPASIRVEIESLEVVVREAGRAEARFIQRYSSPDYSDVVRKTLDLVEEVGEWRILAERVEAP